MGSISLLAIGQVKSAGGGRSRFHESYIAPLSHAKRHASNCLGTAIEEEVSEYLITTCKLLNTMFCSPHMTSQVACRRLSVLRYSCFWRRSVGPSLAGL